VFRQSGRTCCITLAVLTATVLGVTVSARPALAADTALINGGQTYQTIAGFGASEAFGEAASVMNAPSSVQQQVLNDLYSPTSGAGLTILRNEISADSGSTIEPNNPGSPSAPPNYQSLSSINQDQGQLWFAQQIKQDFGVTNVFADAWSAPGFMKTNGSTANGGQVCGVTGAGCGSGDWRQAYANYLLQYAKDYANAGVPLSYVGPSNEPDYSANYDSMTMSGAQMASLLDVVGPTFKNSGLSTQIDCCAATGWPVSGQYASAIESDPTALADTAILTSHGYSGAPTSPMQGWTKPAWETEWSTFESWSSAWDDGSDASGMTWAQHIYQGLTGANLSAFLYWWGSTTPSENGDNEGLLLMNGSNVQTSGRLWAFAGYSRFIRPGAVRIGATSSNGAVDIAAFKNTDGSVAITALNTGTSSDPITYSLSGTGTPDGTTVTPYLTNGSNDTIAQPGTTVSGGSFSATVPGRSLVTYVLKGTTGDVVTVTNPGNQTATVGTPASLQMQATDSASGQTLTYGASGLPAGLSINSSTGLISGTPTATGTSNVTVTATDKTGASGSTAFTWTVGTEQSVTVTNPGNQTGTVGTPVSLQIHATDATAGQTLTYGATGLPAGLSINSSTGLISGTPTTPGTSSVTVTATDTTGASGSASFTWTIGTTNGLSCHVTYTPNQWQGGFTASITIINNGTSAINGWTLTFTFPGDQKITNAWNGVASQTGENVSITNEPYNAMIPAGGNTTLGFQGTWNSSDASPTSFAVNGTTCISPPAAS
jgi:O-glycosyl hydrolase